ncbi:class A beta-lactamase-related serine hydrolase [Jeotgalibacillus sp. S-D1]|uniref:serine hydrolase domain-containing protein n=1 Tax=Jeotgalibacillus sp. S-D1 TaxID=2552189 RepID=UPI00105999F5|nr:serine hydrolase domain-containing protein [Jeotgalibacillus sp. S-D1]TDL31782.1 class A beta-lactamase-related serine hydrolase [Jeotgalibacillus sp. S-D1]
MNTNRLIEKLDKVSREVDFSGVIYAKQGTEAVVNESYGYANRSDQLPNNSMTRFGIASGCKLWTAIAVSQLVEKGQVTFQTKLKDCLPIAFPYFDPCITIHHLLTHTSGIPDYFDEEVMDDFEELWVKLPMYHMKRLHDFLPLFQQKKMMFQAGEKFYYNNAGYILLGLLVEQLSGERFTDYVERNILHASKMDRSGYFSLDQLPENTATGYIDEKDGTWRTNIYSIPKVGGADGGAFIAAEDMAKLWEALVSFKLISEETTKTLLHPHATAGDEKHYGYGIWLENKNQTVYKYHVMGYDPGVCFHSGYYPDTGIKIVVTSNKESGAYPLVKALEKEL